MISNQENSLVAAHLVPTTAAGLLRFFETLLYRPSLYGRNCFAQKDSNVDMPQSTKPGAHNSC